MILSVLIAGVSNRMGKDERQAALKRIEIQRYEKEKQGWNRDIRLVLMPLGLSIVGILCAGTACYLLSGTERKTQVYRKVHYFYSIRNLGTVATKLSLAEKI